MKDRDIISARSFWEISFSGLRCVNEDLSGRTFEGCTFERCDFHECSFIGSTFLNCTFNNCTFNVTRFDKSEMKCVQFNDSRIIGSVYSPVSKGVQFSVAFERCYIYSSSYLDLIIENTPFNECEITDTDFINIDLSGSVFPGTNLKGTRFKNVNLSGVDFSTATNYSINPMINNIKGARFAGPEAFGLLECFNIQIQPWTKPGKGPVLSST